MALVAGTSSIVITETAHNNFRQVLKKKKLRGLNFMDGLSVDLKRSAKQWVWRKVLVEVVWSFYGVLITK